MTSVVFNAENYTSMGSYSYPVFYGCTALSTVKIGEKVKTIPDYAFYDWSSLKNVIIGKSVSQIGKSAFYGCYNIRTITSLNSTPPVCETDVFKDVKTEVTALNVPRESVSLYENAPTWKDFWNITGKDLSGVEDTLADDVDAPAEYYDLNGVRVLNPKRAFTSSDKEEKPRKWFCKLGNRLRLTQPIAFYKTNGANVANGTDKGYFFVCSDNGVV